jgi:hypothetical protein
MGAPRMKVSAGWRGIPKDADVVRGEALEAIEPRHQAVITQASMAFTRCGVKGRSRMRLPVAW